MPQAVQTEAVEVSQIDLANLRRGYPRAAGRRQHQAFLGREQANSGHSGLRFACSTLAIGSLKALRAGHRCGMADNTASTNALSTGEQLSGVIYANTPHTKPWIGSFGDFR